MIKYFIITLVLLLLAMFMLTPGTAMGLFDWYRMPKDERAVDDLLGRIAKSLVKRHHLQVIGTSVSMPGGDVRILGLKFQILGPLTKSELRAIMIDCAQEFLSYVNADEKIRPSLNHYPFSVEDLEMTFFVVDRTGRHVDDPHIRVTWLTYGDLVYRTLQDDKDGMPVPSGQSVESHAEALEAMKREQEGSDQ